MIMEELPQSPGRFHGYFLFVLYISWEDQVKDEIKATTFLVVITVGLILVLSSDPLIINLSIVKG
tara:strand:+ start:232 stop:426 length:195 start_codon:yes stop_codon:yes gene_type:complete